MTDRAPAIERLRNIRNLDSLVEYLRDELGWPLDEDVALEEAVFEYTPEEVHLDDAQAAKINRIWRFRPLENDQPWGIFYIDFKPGKLPVTVLRRILRALVLKKRESANERQAWQAGDLLFISTLGDESDRGINLAHFSDEGDGRTTLRVVDWDEQDSYFHLLRNVDDLHKLRWPDDPTDVNAWREQWSSAFQLKLGEVAKTSKQLAAQMAKLAKVIRARVNGALAIEAESGPLRGMHRAFRETLVHELSEDGFADMYAQTMTYGLFAAARSRPSGVTPETARDMVPNTNPFLRDLLAEFTDVGGLTKTLDFDELGIDALVEVLNQANMNAVLADFDDRNPDEDPVVHFYENFLREYDNKMKAQRGVFFTPRPVVSFIVRSVDELLRTEFGLEDGLADVTTWGEMRARHPALHIPTGATRDTPFIQILDPAVGTGTFLVEVIDVVHTTMAAKWRKQGLKPMETHRMWNEYVAHHLLPRMYGFELMMASYTIAHMKIGLKLASTGYTFEGDERLRIYLTNTLEAPHEVTRQFEGMAPALAHEAVAANEAKSKAAITVVIGNPPYSGISANMAPAMRRLVDAYRFVDGKPIREKGALQFEKNLNDDYVKFVRYVEAKVQASCGVTGLITNNGYLDSATLRGLRSSLLDTFEELRIVDLHGDADRRERAADGTADKNVFEIKHGVAIHFGIRTLVHAVTKATVFITDVLGSQEAKYKWLSSRTIGSVEYREGAPTAPSYLFLLVSPVMEAEYAAGIGLDQAFGVSSTGFESGKDAILVDFTRRELREKLVRLSKLSPESAREEFGIDGGWGEEVVKRRISITADPNFEARLTPFLFSPFDTRWTFFRKDVLKTNSFSAGRHLFHGHNLAVLAMRQVSLHGAFTHIGVTRVVANNRAFYSTKGKVSYYPILLFNGTHDYSDNSGSLMGDNLTPYCRDLFDGSNESGIAESFACFALAVLHSPSYRSRYETQLKRDFPRIPLSAERPLWRELCDLGADLIALHLLDDSYTGASWNRNGGRNPFAHEQASFVGVDRGVVKGHPRYANRHVAINATSGFDGVPESVWQFHIGGYQVCEKWLKDRRGRTLSDEDVGHYGRMIIAVREMIRLMGEIDAVIDKHGGWPLLGGVLADGATS